MNLNTRSNIRKHILNIKNPFCMADLFNRINSQNKLDNELIVQVLNQLYDEGLINYDKVCEATKEYSGYAFFVNNKQKVFERTYGSR